MLNKVNKLTTIRNGLQVKFVNRNLNTFHGNTHFLNFYLYLFK